MKETRDTEFRLEDEFNVDDYCDEIEMLDELRASIHPKKGSSRNARRYIEEYWERKRLEELQKDIFD